LRTRSPTKPEPPSGPALNHTTPRPDPAKVTKTRAQAPLTGAYYWFPRPAPTGLEWELITCHDLKKWSGISHHEFWLHIWELIACHDLKKWSGISHHEFWPHIVERSAAAWGKDAETLKRRLAEHHTGLPRGRINHRRPDYVLLHGDDAPVTDWLPRIIDRFRLGDVKIEVEDTAHHSMAPRDLAAVEEALGVSLGLDRPVR
jgi:hypothetical protein